MRSKEVKCWSIQVVRDFEKQSESKLNNKYTTLSWIEQNKLFHIA